MYRHISSSIIAFLIAVAIFPVTAAGKAFSEKDVNALIERLDNELRKRDSYIAERRERIDSLEKMQGTVGIPDSLRYSAILGLGDEYSAFNTDSAVMFYDLGYRSAHTAGADSVALRFALRKVKVLPLVMFFGESHKLMDSINRVSIPDGLKAEKVEAERQMQFYTANFFTEYPSVYDSIMSLQDEAQSRLLTLLPEDSPVYKLNLAEHYSYRGDDTKAMVILTDLISEIGETDPLYARATHLLAEIAREREDTEGYMYYLALSAIADTRCATLEVASLQELGKLLYENDDIERAHNYLAVALSNAVDCHASLRIIQTSKSIPLIECAHKEQLHASRMRIYAVIVAMAISLIFLAVAIRIAKQCNSQLRTMTARLTDASKTKDVYIAQFLNLCSIYMDKLNQFNKVVNRKLTTGKVDDLLKLTKSGKFIEEQSKEFYEVFDDAFLHLYPNFVAEVNSLLEPDKQIELKENEKLNTDLRILALMRLGVEDTSRIAQMLNYSVYTIYTYRNKFKGRAINRDTFDADVMAIRSVSPHDGASG